MKKMYLFPMNEMGLKFSKIVIFSNQYKILDPWKCYLILVYAMKELDWNNNEK